MYAALPTPLRRAPDLCFGVYAEGPEALSLHLHEIDDDDVLRGVLDLPMAGQLAVLTPSPTPAGARALPGGGWLGAWPRGADGHDVDALMRLLLGLPSPLRVGASALALGGLRPPLELLWVGPDVEPEDFIDTLPASLMLSPQEALASAVTPHLGLVLSGDGEALVFGRDPALLGRLLREPLAQNLRAAFGDGATPPELPLAAVEALMAPMDEGALRELSLEDRARYRALRVEEREADGETVHQRALWVAPRDGGAWRAGWSW